MATPEAGTYGLLVAIAGLLGWVVHGAVMPRGAARTAESSTRAPETGGEPPAVAAPPPAPVELEPAPTVPRQAPRARDDYVLRAPAAAARVLPARAQLLWTAASNAAPRGRTGPPADHAQLVPMDQAGPGLRPLPTTVSARTGDNSYQVVATEGAIIYIGPNGRLLANTGDVDSSGVVALGVGNSTLTSGNSRRNPAPQSPNRSPSAPSPTPTAGATHGNDSFTSLLGSKRSGRGTAISGFEDHSVSVIGNDQVVTYDDSNVFLARNGPINANTGDTDSSGLNAVDVVRSRVRAGNSGDGEGGGEDEDEDEDEGEAQRPGAVSQPSAQSTPRGNPGREKGEDDEEDRQQQGLPVTLAQYSIGLMGFDAAGPRKRRSKASGAAPGGQQGDEGEDDSGDEEDQPSRQALRSRRASERAVSGPGPKSSDEDEDDDEDEKEEGLGDAYARKLGDSWATVTDEGASIASGSESFVVGADGYDDVSIRTRGDRNIVTYDDSNVVIGGEGKVNAQIGDSDTGGAVVMGIADSDVQAGCEGDLCYSDGPSPDRRRAADTRRGKNSASAPYSDTEWPIPSTGRDQLSPTEWPLPNARRNRSSRQDR